MIIPCTYITDADIGIFETSAKINTQTREVFDIESSEDDEQEEINSVNSESIHFNFEGKDYTMLVTFTDSSYEIQDPKDLKVLDILNSKENLDTTLVEKNESKTKMKI